MSNRPKLYTWYVLIEDTFGFTAWKFTSDTNDRSELPSDERLAIDLDIPRQTLFDAENVAVVREDNLFENRNRKRTKLPFVPARKRQLNYDTSVAKWRASVATGDVLLGYHEWSNSLLFHRKDLTDEEATSEDFAEVNFNTMEPKKALDVIERVLRNKENIEKTRQAVVHVEKLKERREVIRRVREWRKS